MIHIILVGSRKPVEPGMWLYEERDLVHWPMAAFFVWSVGRQINRFEFIESARYERQNTIVAI